MPNIDSVIFDLDGTLWDTCASCAIAWNNVLRRRGIQFREITENDVRKVTGKPHEACIRETFAGLPEVQIVNLIQDTMTEDNSMVAQHGAVLYEGVLEGLKVIRESFPLFIVSNCQAGYIETFLKYSQLGKAFVDFECWGDTGKTKAENLASVIGRNGLKKPVFVGDADSDLTAARLCKVPFYFASYGFGSVNESDAVFSSFRDLVKLLVGQD